MLLAGIQKNKKTPGCQLKACWHDKVTKSMLTTFLRIQMKKWTFASTIFLLFFPVFSHAQVRPVGTITLGSDSAYLPLNENITILAPFQNSYISALDHDAEFVGGIFLGGEFSLPCHWSDQLGISYYQNS